MKLRIKAESYYLTPKPKLTRTMFDWFWYRFSYTFQEYIPRKDFAIETIEIRLNRALPWMDIHFYVTINGVYEFHIQGGDYDFKKFKDNNDYMELTYNEYFSRKNRFMKIFNIYVH